MDHFLKVYKTQAAAYHALIAAEDADGHLLPALQAITSLAGKRVLDLGSGTGRIPLLLRGLGCEIVAVDLHRAMLEQQRSETGDTRLVQADLRRLPLAGSWADVVMAGWAIGHFVGWNAEGWRVDVGRTVDEMRRAAKPGGTLIILETLGTGVQQPAPPTAGLAKYYAVLENEFGFTHKVVSTDYDFGSVERAAELCGFFFGEQLGTKITSNGWERVPEYTGLWFLPC